MRKGWYSFCLVGFSEGFPIHYDGLRESSDAKNLILALENPDVVDIKIKKELDARRLPGPFIAHPFPHFSPRSCADEDSWGYSVLHTIYLTPKVFL